jgi:hypothetical protein
VSDRQPILVTGSHRSGTTWVGRMLSLAPGVGYIEEPFSLRHRRGIFDVTLPYWFMYVTAENQEPYAGPLSETLAFRYHPWAELGTLRSPKDVGRMGRDWWRTSSYRRRGARPLIKDPIALFSAEWLAHTFNVRVVVTIRHPAGFASSLMRLGWRHPFDHFLSQPLLMRDWLTPFEREIRAFAADERPLLDQAILLWKVIHHVIAGFQERHPDWLYVRHEDLAPHPLPGFRRLHERLGLPLDQQKLESIALYSDPTRPAEAKNPFDVRRDSRGSASLWKDRLSAEEIARIRSGVEPFADRFYGQHEW